MANLMDDLRPRNFFLALLFLGAFAVIRKKEPSVITDNPTTN
jgi:hypothetical protein